MLNPRSQLANLEPDTESDEGPLTPKQERFAQVWALTDNQSVAYRRAYDVGDRTLPATVWKAASVRAQIPKIRARYNELRQAALNETMMPLREMLQWHLDIATADPNEIVRVVARNCRHCRGFNFEYQWRDEDELIAAQIEAMDAKKEPPQNNGGFGFSGGLEPVLECPHCYGRGVEHVEIADTTKLVGKARKLYAGAEQDRYGCIKVKMHDQQAAWDKVLRMRGGYKDTLDLRTPEQRAAEAVRNRLPENVTIEDASKAYIELLG